MRRAWRVLFALAAARALALLHRGQAVGWDEIEFFHASRWIAAGLVPYRDFWEHHLPLQWFVFAPIASLFGGSPGAAAIVVMRYAQLALWLAVFVIVLRLAIGQRWIAAAFLLASTTFAVHAIEYRVDVLGNLLLLGAVLLIAERRDRWITCGVLLSASVLANMRFAPMVVLIGIYLLWRFRLRALRLLIGASIVAALFSAYLALTHAWPAFIADVIHYNTTSPKMIEHHTFFDTLLAPVWSLDVAGVVLWLFAVAGCVIAFRAGQDIVPVVFIASIVNIAMLDVQYEYHFQLTFLLMVPLASLAFGKLAERWQPLAAVVAAAAIAIALLQMLPRFGNAMEYQDAVMRSVDRLTTPDETVFDGAGYALRRKPAHRYWFLPTGVRLMTARGLLPRYDFMKSPPGAVIADYRMHVYLAQFPDLTRDVVTHSVPLYRNLWIPGCSGAGTRVTCVATKAGTYDLYASEVLLRHPWFQRPLEFSQMPGDYAIPLARLPRTNVSVRVDGAAAPAGPLVLRKGARVEIDASSRTGVLLVPRGIGTLAIGPADEQFVF